MYRSIYPEWENKIFQWLLICRPIISVGKSIQLPTSSMCYSHSILMLHQQHPSHATGRPYVGPYAAQVLVVGWSDVGRFKVKLFTCSALKHLCDCLSIIWLLHYKNTAPKTTNANRSEKTTASKAINEWHYWTHTLRRTCTWTFCRPAWGI